MDAITQVLQRINNGEADLNALLPLVYQELRRLAAKKLAREKPGQTLDATGLVHEVFLRIGCDQNFENRRHFFAAAAESMRRILVDNVRRKGRIKHAGGWKRQNMDLDEVAVPAEDQDILDLDEALARFAAIYPQKAKLVELRFFAGLTGDEAARILEISPSTADRDWVFARAWLRSEMGSDASTS